jgi:hypothetical protein
MDRPPKPPERLPQEDLEILGARLPPIGTFTHF